ncbi:MAG TPA: hypothetical protein PLV70_14740 [Flavobacteriales bacterium]|jgi:hypothetical protein|nr:hypothetical protein [Flavobacteriales bacterium]HRO39193.1 hypothetical protein [Flavobacteriales bacterium]HRQ86361.1 hypothetical protein [Flavobacteriales bacterium]
MLRLQPHPGQRSTDRGQVIFLGGLISAALAVVLLMLAYKPW